MWTDGTTATGDGGSGAWLCMVEHRLGRALLGCYRLGDSERAAEHWLLADRWQGRLDVGAARDVEHFLATQPFEMSAALEGLTPDEHRAAVARAVVQLHAHSAQAPDALLGAAEASLGRERELAEQLAAWLDRLLDGLDP